MRKFFIALGLVAILANGAFAKVYATVDGEEITEKDLLFLRQVMPNLDFDKLEGELKTRAIEQAIERKLFTKEAKKGGFENTKEYKEALESFKDTMVLELWMQKQMEGVSIPESEVKKYYNENKDRLVVPENATARHILVATEQEAKDIIKELDKAQKGKVEEKFIELARAKSSDPSAQDGGNIGTFTREQLTPAFSNAAFNLKTKTYTKTPVKTDYGWHVIYLTDKKAASAIKYNEAKQRLENDLKLQKFRDEMAVKGRKMRDEAKVVIK